MKLSLFYIITPPLFLVAGILIGIFFDVNPSYWGIVIAYVVLNALAFPIRAKGCKVCAMRLVCPGSAVKK